MTVTPRWRALLLALVCVASLAGVGFATRARRVGADCLNGDEAVYLATASYLNGTGQSAFNRPIQHVYTYWMFQGFAALIGPYEMRPIRWIFLGLYLLISLLLWAVSRRWLGTSCALLAALIFSYASLYYQGIEWTRESMSLPALLVSGWWYAQVGESENSSRRRWGICGAAFLAGCTGWIKEQGAILALAIAADVVYRGVRDRTAKRTFADLAGFLAGFVAAGFLLAVPMVLRGTLDEQWYWLWTIEARHAQRSAPMSLASRLAVEFEGLYLHRPFRALVAVADLAAAAIGTSMFRRAVAGRRATARPDLPIFLRWSVSYLLLALFVTQLGGRFNTNYYLYCLPAESILVAAAFRWLARRPPASRPQAALVALAMLVIAADVVGQSGEVIGSTAVLTLSSAAVWQAAAGVFAAALLGLGLCAVARPLSIAEKLLRVLLIGIVLAEVGTLVAETHLYPDRAVSPEPPEKIANVAQRLRRETRSDDRLFVWGWQPEIYVASRLTPASIFTHTVDVIGDTSSDYLDQPTYDGRYDRGLLIELGVTRNSLCRRSPV